MSAPRSRESSTCRLLTACQICPGWRIRLCSLTASRLALLRCGRRARVPGRRAAGHGRLGTTAREICRRAPECRVVRAVSLAEGRCRRGCREGSDTGPAGRPDRHLAAGRQRCAAAGAAVAALPGEPAAADLRSYQDTSFPGAETIAASPRMIAFVDVSPGTRFCRRPPSLMTAGWLRSSAR